MKIKDVKHNHSLTDLLKVGIFSILMLAPMINVGVRSAYVICNKNAYQSYYGETINQYNYELINYNELQIGKTYNYHNDTPYTIENTVSATNFYVSGVVDNLGNFAKQSGVNYTLEEVDRILIWKNGNNNLSFEFHKTNENAYWYANTSSIINFDFLFNGWQYNDATILPEVKWLYTKEYVNYSYLDNVFEYSVNQLAESPLYNWVENTAIYSGVALMNTQLGITQPVISLLVVYWLLLTIIYIIIDIIIRVFTWLTHMIGSKTA